MMLTVALLRLCDHTASSQAGFENHLAGEHGLCGQREVEERYRRVWGKLCTLVRQHQCYICRKLIRHEYKVLFHHLAKHQLDLESYCTRYKDRLVKELREKGMGYIVERAEEVAGAVRDHTLTSMPVLLFCDIIFQISNTTLSSI